MKIDLHLHSSFSDGSFSPEELVRIAVRKKLDVIALTDHDTVEGVPRFLAAGADLPITLVPGIEISTRIDSRSIHILGYGIDWLSPALIEGVKKIQIARRERNRKILARLQGLGIRLSAAELASQGDGQIGRPHIARLLVKHGFVKNIQEGFIRYLRRGQPAFVEQERPDAATVISMIKNAHGLSFLAHPGTLDPTLSSIPELVDRLKDFGLDGLEVYYPSHPRHVWRQLEKLAGKMNLLASGGTDFHGYDRSASPPGGSPSTFRIPETIWEKVSRRLMAQRSGTGSDRCGQT